ncbi:hypothetical protein ES703_110057 [subsurface metagenome]
MPDYEKLPPSVFKAAWLELAKCLGERLQQDELDLMDSVLQSVELDMEEKQILRRFPHLATKEADEEEL